ncbi:hypothetical protein PG985_014858 [Apiospora marii]|uniref:Uncharacterized protein n=1 Tax=Apiospora marii TaxID=335849 RepID=A0ABR1RJ88_9PEZI
MDDSRYNDHYPPSPPDPAQFDADFRCDGRTFTLVEQGIKKRITVPNHHGFPSDSCVWDFDGDGTPAQYLRGEGYKCAPAGIQGDQHIKCSLLNEKRRSGREDEYTRNRKTGWPAVRDELVQIASLRESSDFSSIRRKRSPTPCETILKSLRGPWLTISRSKRHRAGATSWPSSSPMSARWRPYRELEPVRYPVIIAADSPVSSPEKLQVLAGLSEVPEVMTVKETDRSVDCYTEPADVGSLCSSGSKEGRPSRGRL